MRHRIINMSFTVSFYRNSGRKDDSTGGPLWQWKDFLCQPPKEAVRTSRGTDPAGWKTAAPLQTKILTSKGTFNPLEQIKCFRNDHLFLFRKVKFIYIAPGIMTIHPIVNLDSLDQSGGLTPHYHPQNHTASMAKNS